MSIPTTTVQFKNSRPTVVDVQDQVTAALRQPWKHQSVLGRLVLQNCPHNYLQHCTRTYPEAEIMQLCAPSHPSTASTPLQTYAPVILLTCCPRALATLPSTNCIGAEVPMPQKQKSTSTSSQTHQLLTLSPSSDAAIFMLSQFADSQENLIQENIMSAVPGTV